MRLIRYDQEGRRSKEKDHLWEAPSNRGHTVLHLGLVGDPQLLWRGDRGTRQRPGHLDGLVGRTSREQIIGLVDALRALVNATLAVGM